ncbi:MAG: DUF104 domain-containing protein [Crenarchaeota archaeon]|nr:DUF104 domain-containing protein [Thermoproteota archaeon]
MTPASASVFYPCRPGASWTSLARRLPLRGYNLYAVPGGQPRHAIVERSRREPKPLERLELHEGEVLLVRVLRKGLAERVSGSIRVDREELERVLKEVEDGLGAY